MRGRESSKRSRPKSQRWHERTCRIRSCGCEEREGQELLFPSIHPSIVCRALKAWPVRKGSSRDDNQSPSAPCDRPRDTRHCETRPCANKDHEDWRSIAADRRACARGVEATARLRDLG